MKWSDLCYFYNSLFRIIAGSVLVSLGCSSWPADRTVKGTERERARLLSPINTGHSRESWGKVGLLLLLLPPPPPPCLHHHQYFSQYWMELFVLSETVAMPCYYTDTEYIKYQRLLRLSLIQIKVQFQWNTLCFLCLSVYSIQAARDK